MSAFIVSHDHIDALVTYAVTKGLTRRTPTEAGQVLLAENAKSVAHRYNEGVSNEPTLYRHRTFTKPLPAIAILKAVDCLAYQSCEHDGWESSDAKALLDTIRDTAIRAVPGYAEAQWEISRGRAA